MPEPIISVTNLGKKYNINHQLGGYISLREVITNTFKNPFKFAKSKAKALLGKTKEDFWALRDVNFTVQSGEVIGVIGRNGAGKSTLLKILTNITPPTTGEITMKGKVSSLLEVGTGFHPELTGRENIFLNGAILGMTQKEISVKFDEIVEFAGIKKFLDTPVKYYSSGMYVRLAFSVAAHMEPDILLVDEVLAVGDAEFQKKCLGKMEQITKQSGRTILFVSHNMAAISELCTRCILLKDGTVNKIGPTEEIISHYLESVSQETKINNRMLAGPLTPVIEFSEILVNDTDASKELSPAQPFSITLKGTCKESLPHFQATFSIYQNDVRIASFFDLKESNEIKEGAFTSRIVIPARTLRPGRYSIAIGGETLDGKWLYGTHIKTFTISQQFKDRNDKHLVGLINIPYEGTRTQ